MKLKYIIYSKFRSSVLIGILGIKLSRIIIAIIHIEQRFFSNTGFYH